MLKLLFVVYPVMVFRCTLMMWSLLMVKLPTTDLHSC